MIIAIDGPAGAGKSTLARALARELGMTFLDTGAMYRAVALVGLRRGLPPDDEAALAALAASLRLDFDAAGRILIDGAPGEPDIRSERVSTLASTVSALPAVRRALVAKQREVAALHGGVVGEGRDLTTVVFPDADFRFYLDASPAERARRRAEQLGTPERLAEIQAAIEARDEADSTREDSPLRLAAGVTHVDTDGLGADEVLATLLGRVRAEERR